MPQSSSFDSIADGLADKGYGVCDGFLNPVDVASILGADEFRNHKLLFRKATIGKDDRQIREDVRGDLIRWIDPRKCSSPLVEYHERLMALLASLNQNLFLSLKEIELHCTVYPVGTFYARHRDQFRAEDSRKLSILCYLNPDWKESEGGQLRMHLDDGHVDIFPQAGRLVCFRSDQVDHEVLSATRDRFSLTAWALDKISSLR